MAIPVLYWMLECKECRSRFVVRDSYRKFVGVDPSDYVTWPDGSLGPLPGAGYGGPPLEQRYKCAKGCTQGLTPLASIFHPTDEAMWLHEPHERVAMTRAQRKEWTHLIHEAGLASHGDSSAARRPWWKIW